MLCIPGSRTAICPVSSSTGTLTCHQRTGASPVWKAARSSRPRSMPEPPTMNSFGRRDTSSRANPAPSVVPMIRTDGWHGGSWARRPSERTRSDTWSTRYCATSGVKLAAPTQTPSSQRAAPRSPAGAATSSTKARAA